MKKGRASPISTENETASPDGSAPWRWTGPAILLVAVLIRIPFLDVEGFWYDEIRSVNLARLPWSGFWTSLLRQDVHPPLYFIGLKWWGTLFGWSEVATRALSVFFVLGSIQVLFSLGKRTGTLPAAWFAGAYLAVSPMSIRYSLEVRPYAALMFLATCTLLADHLWAGRNPAERGKMLLWLGTHTALPLIHYAGGLFLLAKEICLAYSSDHPPRRRQALSCGAVALFLALWVPFLWQQVQASGQHPLSHLSLSVSPMVALMHFSLDPMGDLFPGISADLLAWGGGALFCLALIRFPLIPGVALINLLAIWGAGQFLPFGEPRNLIASLPLFAYGLGLALVILFPRQLLSLTLCLLLVGAFLLPKWTSYRPRTDFRPLAKWVRAMEERDRKPLALFCATEEARLGMHFHLGSRPVTDLSAAGSASAPVPLPDDFVFVRHAFAESREAEVLAARMKQEGFFPLMQETTSSGQTEGIRLFRKR